MFLIVASAICTSWCSLETLGKTRQMGTELFLSERRMIRRWIGRWSFTVMCLTTDDSGPWRAVETKSVGRVASRQIFHQFAYATFAVWRSYYRDATRWTSLCAQCHRRTLPCLIRHDFSPFASGFDRSVTTCVASTISRSFPSFLKWERERF